MLKDILVLLIVLALIALAIRIGNYKMTPSEERDLVPYYHQLP